VTSSPLPRRSVAGWLADLAVLLPVLLIALCIVYQVLFALEVVTLGELPGENPPSYDAFLLAGLLGMILGAVVSVTVALSGQKSWLVLLLPALAIVFVIARHFTFDSYYGDDMVRFSERGTGLWGWIAFLAVWAVVATWLTKYVPSLGPPIASTLLLACAMTAVLQQAGH